MKIGQFLRDTRAEMGHVIWPTKSRAALYAVIVIVLSLAVGYLLFGFDTLFQTLLRNLLAS